MDSGQVQAVILIAPIKNERIKSVFSANGPRFTIEYRGGQLDDIYEVEGDTYDGHDLDELANDIIELIDIKRLTFGVYPVVIDTTEVIPEIYDVLLPGCVPKFDEIKDWQLYEHLLDRILHMENVTHCSSDAK